MDSNPNFKDHTSLFLTSHHQKRLPHPLQMLVKFDHVFTLVDLRLNSKTPFTAIHVETGVETL